MKYSASLKYLLLAFLIGLSSAAPPQSKAYKFVNIQFRTVNASLDVIIEIGKQMFYDHNNKCFIKIQAQPYATKMHITSLDVLGDSKTMLLSKFDEFERRAREVTFMTINLEDCSAKPFEKNQALFIKKDNSQVNWMVACRPPFDMSMYSMGWSEYDAWIEVVAENRLLVQYRDAAGKFEALIYNAPRSYRPLLSISNASNVHVVSANLTICQGSNNTATCSKFDENGNVKSFEKVIYPENVVLSWVENTESGHIMLVARSLNCQSTEMENCGSNYFFIASKDYGPTQTQCLDSSLYQCLKKNKSNPRACDVEIEFGDFIPITDRMIRSCSGMYGQPRNCFSEEEKKSLEFPWESIITTTLDK